MAREAVGAPNGSGSMLRGSTRADEEEMARRIDQSWDRTLELTLEENGIRV